MKVDEPLARPLPEVGYVPELNTVPGDFWLTLAIQSHQAIHHSVSSVKHVMGDRCTSSQSDT